MQADRLDELRQQAQFDGWQGHVPDAGLAGVRDVFDRLLNELIALADASGPDELEPLFTKCIDELNQLDEPEPFLMTIEREELCDVLFEIAAACDVDDEEVVEEWLEDRDW